MTEQTSLDTLAIKYETDKSSLHHDYCSIYEKLFSNLRQNNFVFIECGIGGYEYIDRGGQSAKMWREYFPLADIITFDINEKNIPNFEGITVFKGSQIDREFIVDMFTKVGNPNVFLDDGSHVNSHVIETFEIVFPLLKPQGIYVVEDFETSFYERDGFGGTLDISDYTANTSLNYFRKLVDEVNYKYIEGFTPNEIFKDQIESISFYRNLIVITKK